MSNFVFIFVSTAWQETALKMERVTRPQPLWRHFSQKKKKKLHSCLRFVGQWVTSCSTKLQIVIIYCEEKTFSKTAVIWFIWGLTLWLCPGWKWCELFIITVTHQERLSVCWANESSTTSLAYRGRGGSAPIRGDLSSSESSEIRHQISGGH